MSEGTRSPMTETQRGLARKLDAVGWGLFFIWVGIAALASVGWGVGLLGVGVIMLGGQAGRKYLRLPVERFAVAVGALFFFGGMLRLLGIPLGKPVLPWGFVPILFILAGASLLVSALRHRPADRTAR